MRPFPLPDRRCPELNRKQKIMIAAGGNAAAAWLLDTMVWAAETVGDGQTVPWPLRKVAEVCGMSYQQARRALMTLQRMEVIERDRRAVKIVVDWDAVVGVRHFELSASDTSNCRRPTLPLYIGDSRNLLPGGSDMAKDDDGVLSQKSLLADDDEPEPAGKGFEERRRRFGLDKTRKSSVDDLCRASANVPNCLRLWSALNVAAGRHPATGNQWNRVRLKQALEDLEPDALAKIRQVYERWEGWSAFARAETGMRAPKIPHLWHVGHNVGSVEAFLTSGVGVQDAESYDPSKDEW